MENLSVGDWLRLRLRLLGLTQRAASEETGICESKMSALANNEYALTDIKARHFKSLADLLQIKMSDLYEKASE
ncbi:MAG: hypothetical protein AAGJ95_13955 [Cyanobacteria bacterium J06554_11]